MIFLCIKSANVLNISVVMQHLWRKRLDDVLDKDPTSGLVQFLFLHSRYLIHRVPPVFNIYESFI